MAVLRSTGAASAAAAAVLSLVGLAACGSFEASSRERAAATAADPAAKEQGIVDGARTVIQEAKTDPAFGTAPDLLRRARAIVIVPNVVKAAFVFGGEGGQGVMVARTPSGGWSDPAFVTLGAASVGFQIGVEQADLVIFAMSDKAVQGLLQNQFTFGAQAGLSVATLGSTAAAATSPKLDADIILWAKSAGAYAGLSVDGTVLKQREDYDMAYYGRRVTPDEILRGTVRNPRAASLRQALPPAVASRS
jgi:lipid-binding SYLF domain-containing protein